MKRKLLEVRQFTINSKASVKLRVRYKESSEENSCTSCMYLSPSEMVCNLPVKVQYRKGKCTYKKVKREQ